MKKYISEKLYDIFETLLHCYCDLEQQTATLEVLLSSWPLMSLQEQVKDKVFTKISKMSYYHRRAVLWSVL